MNRRELLLHGAGWTLAGTALAQPAGDYPKAGMTIRYVVPFPPGGLTDQMARMLGQQLGQRWKVNVVIDNKPGAGGMLGADVIAKAPGDGSNLLAVTLTHAINATLFKAKAAYDFERDLKPVALLAASPMLIVVPAASPIKDLKDLMAQARAKTLSAGSSGNGTPPHVMLALFNDLNGSQVQHVPYKGGAPSMTDLMGGQLDVIFSNLPESVAHVKGGKLRALAVGSPQRNPLVPEAPTTAEAGMPLLVMENWTGLMAPAATPEPVVQRLSEAVLQILAQRDLEERVTPQGFRIDRRGYREFSSFTRSEVERWAAVLDRAHIRAD